MKRSMGFGLAAALLAAVGLAGLAEGQGLTKVTFSVTTKDISVGHAAHSSLPVALGYWKDEGLDVSVTSVEGSTAGAQQLGAGNIQFVSLGPETILISREKGVPIKAFYVQARETIFRIVAPADSDVKELKDLRGKTLGVNALSSGAVPYAKALLGSLGLQLDRDYKLLAVGTGAPGALALQQKKVDALALWDTLQAGMELRGLAFRRLSAPMHDQLIGQTIASSDAYLGDHSRAAVGFARGIAKATLFGLTNPEAAIRIHWKAYPETKPQGVDEAKALKEAVHVFKSRFELQRVDHREDKRYGFASRAQWDALKKVYTEQGVTKGSVDVGEVYTDKLVDEINRFDKAAIIRQAKEWKP